MLHIWNSFLCLCKIMNVIKGHEVKLNMLDRFELHRYTNILSHVVNSLAPGISECDSKNVTFNLVLLIGIFRSSHDNALWLMIENLTDDKSTLVQVMVWFRQAINHYLSQCWPRSLSPYGVTRFQCINLHIPNHPHTTHPLCYLANPLMLYDGNVFQNMFTTMCAFFCCAHLMNT